MRLPILAVLFCAACAPARPGEPHAPAPGTGVRDMATRIPLELVAEPRRAVLAGDPVGPRLAAAGRPVDGAVRSPVNTLPVRNAEDGGHAGDSTLVQYQAWRAVAAGEGRSAAPDSSPLALVLRQVDAFNAHDADAFAAAYAEDAEQRVLGPRDSVEIRGRQGFRDRAAALFRRAPALRVEVLSQLEAGPYVVLHERATGTPDGRASDAVYTYEVQGDRITRVWRTRRVPGDPAA